MLKALREKKCFAKTVWLPWFPSYLASFWFFLEQWASPLNSLFDRPSEEAFLLANPVVIRADFETRHSRHEDFYFPFVHFREPYLWFLVAGSWPGLKRV